MHIMLDLETLGTSPNATILQIGAVPFELQSGGRVYTDKAFNAYFDISEDSFSEVSHGTFRWWLGQSDAARGKLIAGMKDLKSHPATILEAFTKWPVQGINASWASIEGLWAKGTHFDVAILESAYRRHGLKHPWRYNKVYDLRTAFLLTTGGQEPQLDRAGSVAHDALDDCVHQICQLQTALGGE